MQTRRVKRESLCIMYLVYHTLAVSVRVRASFEKRKKAWMVAAEMRSPKNAYVCCPARMMARLWSPSRTALMPNLRPPQYVHERYNNVTLLFIILLLSLWRERVIAAVVVVQRIRLRKRLTRLTDRYRIAGTCPETVEEHVSRSAWFQPSRSFGIIWYYYIIYLHIYVIPLIIIFTGGKLLYHYHGGL